jgi:hypothetical protein
MKRLRKKAWEQGWRAFCSAGSAVCVRVRACTSLQGTRVITMRLGKIPLWIHVHERAGADDAGHVDLLVVPLPWDALAASFRLVTLRLHLSADLPCFRIKFF